MVTFLFALGNSSNAFLLLRSKDLGFDEGGVILLYLLYTLTASVLSIPFGRRSDRVGRKPLLVGAYLIFSLVYLNFALGLGKGMIILAFVLYGVFTAMITGTERAYVVEIAPGELRGTLLGLQGTLGGIALLPASLIAGLLWNIFGPRAPFLFGSFLSLLAGLALLFFMKEGHLDKAQ